MKNSYIKLSGFVTKEPELRATAKGEAVCTVRLGVTDRFLDRENGDWRESEPSYYNITCWRRLAENVAFSLRKGDRVTVHGSCRTRTWVDRNNNPRVELEITANSVGHDLLFSITKAVRNGGPQQPSPESLAAGEASRQGLEAGPGMDSGGPGSPFDLDPAPYEVGAYDASQYDASQYGTGYGGTDEGDGNSSGEALAAPSAPGEEPGAGTDGERLQETATAV